MKTSWTALLDAQMAADIKSNFKASLLTRKRLATLLRDKVESADKQARSKLTYDNPNWSLLQADERGYQRALYEVIDLILEDSKENNTTK